MTTTVQKGYAKINLHLDITGIMSDGYHSVNTFMQSFSLCDTVALGARDDNEYILTCNVVGVPLDGTNLAIRAAKAFEEAIGRRLGATIHIDKSIPMAGGLAGGSADAAAVLRGLNELCGHPLSTKQLCAIGGKLGADIPFCIVGGAAFADGKGDILHPFPTMPDCTIVIACGGEGVSTPEAYRTLDGLYGGFAEDSGYTPKSMSELYAAANAGDLDGIAANIFNIFESPILAVRPVAAELKKLMLSGGAINAMMSGSGPSVFGIFDSEYAAQCTCDKIRKTGVTPHICKPMSI